MPSGWRPLNAAEHHSICEMVEKISVLGVVFTSQDVKCGKMQHRQKMGKLRSSIKLKEETAAAVSLLRFAIFQFSLTKSQQ
jgi:hypothetical protein